MTSIDSRRPLKVAFLDRGALPGSIRLRPLQFPHTLHFHDHSALSEVAERIADADIVVTNKVAIRPCALATARHLKLIAVAATGTDIVDTDACAESGVTVSNIKNYAIHTVSEHTFALILALRRSVLLYRDSVESGRWQQSDQFCFFDHPIPDLAGSTLGIIGDGVLGKAVADIAKAFGMRVLFSAYKGESGMGPLYTAFEEVLRQSDIITMHSSLLPSTRNMIGAPEFAAMSRRPLLINTARGGLVDENALHDALQSGQISGAGFDVATAEPPPSDHVLTRLLELPNFLLTPHVAWASRQATQELADQLIDNIELFIKGTPRNVVGSSLRSNCALSLKARSGL
ncbi:D-2-hydroxyacid dehydrogenase [Mesorhizobium sp. ES1-4]|uniref:D-2-hydroxyacid dehydrogenase n=1 Tax=Mesorhizobium sp. ES1-4 TaxID=2876627 RepID=UPI001CCA4F4E|nr:D-2-hydroxyacid dehydrogenase [Mesorhizobium sp. ES1-4]MBZ9799871.1 D-2-hydroxyacid dehydrogenase [Mesorhizobium sp. ES1-4]